MPVKTSVSNRIKLSTYGNPKTGKTRIGCSFKKPILIIGAEDGTDSVVGIKGIDFVQLQRSQEIFTLIDLLQNDKSKWKKDAKNNWTIVTDGSGVPYASVVLDTATKLRDLRICEIKGIVKDIRVVQKAFKFAGRDEWMQCASDMKEMLGPLLDIPRTQDMNVVIVAQEANLTKEDTRNDDEMIRPEIGSAVGKSVSDFINAECSYIGQTFIRQQTVTKTKKRGNVEEEVTELTGKNEYCLRIGPHPIYVTGFRVRPDRTDDVPDVIVNPSYEKILAVIEGREVK